MKTNTDYYISTSSKRFGYFIIKMVPFKAETKINKYYIYKPNSIENNKLGQFVKECSSYKFAVNWCKLNRKN